MATAKRVLAIESHFIKGKKVNVSSYSNRGKERVKEIRSSRRKTTQDNSYSQVNTNAEYLTLKSERRQRRTKWGKFVDTMLLEYWNLRSEQSFDENFRLNSGGNKGNVRYDPDLALEKIFQKRVMKDWTFTRKRRGYGFSSEWSY